MDNYRNKNVKRARDYLGGKCIVCGTTDNLEFDHIDPNTKSFVVSQKINYSWERLRVELDKCQLLCRKDHRAKTNAHLSRPIVHGTTMGYRKHKCRCDECKAHNATNSRRQYAARQDADSSVGSEYADNDERAPDPTSEWR